MHRNWSRALPLVLSGVFVGPAYAGPDLANFIQDLYGGQGLFLPPAPDIPEDIANGHVPHFTGEQQIEELSALSNGLVAGSSVYAINSTVTGVSFDLSKGVPVAVEDSLGPLLTERATTIGQGRLNLGFGYSRNDFSELDGKDLGSLQVTLSHQDCCQVGPPPIGPPDGDFTGFERDTIILDIDIELEQEVFALFASYGITDQWDVGVVVPVVKVKATAVSVATINVFDEDSTFGGNPVHSFETDPNLAVSRTGGDETGLGDVILRTKYNITGGNRNAPVDLAVLGQVTLATGEEDDLLGTGEDRYKVMGIASKRMGNLTPHINLAYEKASGADELDNYSYALGLDARLSSQVSGSVAVMGRKNPDLEEIGNNVLDFAVGIKWNPFTDFNAPINAFVSVPLNDDGLRSDFVWGLGVDLVFD